MTMRWVRRLAALLVLLPMPAAEAQDKPYSTDAGEQVVAAGSIGGSWFVITTAMYDLFQRNIEGLRYTVTPGGAVANPMAVEQGLATSALGYNSLLHAASRGEPPYRKVMADFRGILNLNVAGVVHPI
ncbi:MAG: TAXI family TRAP transporter solute-binding subunit, partial [Alphaproteobacteria bacterium]|nr:TAXI family TRAP transporter solute-binding subunit [Alphaproteobacteria bacterium]